MKYDVLVIGGGQAGLTVGYYLRKTNYSFLILDQGKEIGEVWKNRYDSLKLFTPRSYSALPGLALEGDQNGYPTKDEVAHYLTSYAKKFNLPIKLNTSVQRIYKENHEFKISTNDGEFSADNVIIATGAFQKPLIPEFESNLNENIYQFHSSQYKNPKQLRDGPVLVVGGGNSGAQIAAELSKERETYLSISHKLKFLPQDILNKSIFWWFDKFGIYSASVHSAVGKIVKKQADPIFGYELKQLIKDRKVIIKPRTKFADHDTILFEDNSHVKVHNIIWSTGFRSDYNWIDIDGVFDDKGQPIHERGISSISGLYFIGLPWQYSRGSALLLGVGKDAKFLVSNINMNFLNKRF